MKRKEFRFAVLCLMLLVTVTCRKAYNPPEIASGNHFLSVDGFINTSPGSVSSFHISRSRNLSDSVTDIPETNASADIVSANGDRYPLHDTTTNGIYFSASLTLDPAQSYQLSIHTSDGNEYLSDLVPSKSAPPVDSLNWELSDDPITGTQVVRIYVNSHDPTNSTHYYRWDYLETYEHQSVYETPWGEADGLIYPYPVGYGTHRCWTTAPSTDILLGSSVALSSDVISHALVASLYQNDPRMDFGYSIQVRQYPLTEDAYNYWLTVQKNSQSLGGLFDLQPSQITGNIHCTSNPANPALGYISASSVQSNRLYISNKSLPGWQSNPIYSCPQISIPTDPLNLLIYNYPDTAYGPYHFEGDFTIFLVVAPKNCMDCRYQGGTNIKPDFWP